MKERPILFSGPMVRVILAGSQTMTRRVVRLRAGESAHEGGDGSLHGVSNTTWGDSIERVIQCPYGVPGDMLWVRETWRYSSCSGYTPANGPARYQATLEYKSTYDNPINFQRLGKTVELPEMHYGGNLRKDGDVAWKPSIFMPRWASRLTLRIMSVSVERVQEITLKDVEQEGLYCDTEYSDPTRTSHYAYEPGMRIHFTKLWDSLNAKRGFRWDTNPWVWVIGFERVQQRLSPPASRVPVCWSARRSAAGTTLCRGGRGIMTGDDGTTGRTT